MFENKKEILEKGMKSEIGWEFKGKLSDDIIAIKKPGKRFLEIIYENLDVNILKKAIADFGYYLNKTDVKGMTNIKCAKCPLLKECKQAIITDKELDYYSVYQSASRSFLGKPIMQFLKKIVRIYTLEQSLKILDEYEKLLKESKDEIRNIMLYGNSAQHSESKKDAMQ